jgi:hypothetical protein
MMMTNDSTAVAKGQILAGGACVMVVGHSNTIPELIKGLGIATPISLADDDYDNLFVIVFGQEPRLLRLHYH